MIHGSATPPARRQHLILLAVALLALCSVGMIAVGMLDRPAEPSWAHGQQPQEPTATPAASFSVSASPDPTSASPAPARTTVPARRLSSKPSAKPSGKPSAKPSKKPSAKPSKTTPKPAGSPSPAPPSTAPTSAGPRIAQLLADCSPQGARAQTRSGISLLCTTRPWDPALRWRLG